MIRLVKLK